MMINSEMTTATPVTVCKIRYISNIQSKRLDKKNKRSSFTPVILQERDKGLRPSENEYNNEKYVTQMGGQRCKVLFRVFFVSNGSLSKELYLSRCSISFYFVVIFLTLSFEASLHLVCELGQKAHLIKYLSIFIPLVNDLDKSDERFTEPTNQAECLHRISLAIKLGQQQEFLTTYHIFNRSISFLKYSVRQLKLQQRELSPSSTNLEIRFSQIYCPLQAQDQSKKSVVQVQPSHQLNEPLVTSSFNSEFRLMIAKMTLNEKYYCENYSYPANFFFMVVLAVSSNNSYACIRRNKTSISSTMMCALFSGAISSSIQARYLTLSSPIKLRVKRSSNLDSFLFIRCSKGTTNSDYLISKDIIDITRSYSLTRRTIFISIPYKFQQHSTSSTGQVQTTH
ncbi:UNKNOWN [Stylonychia lemnae]|uniref:Uncharacterized protein n=1 Tax=Stylonychia lemnae TaxID=5949 RepID=A0A078AF90_STYLE|nr:UNKNOWN [Stylonychia lemnae]|eukprot:CDW79583.1 UNKNOWN [Stylonychia lemnae]